MTTSDRQGRSAMRHDPAGASIIIMLRSLKLRGMAHMQWMTWSQKARPRLRLQRRCDSKCSKRKWRNGRCVRLLTTQRLRASLRTRISQALTSPKATSTRPPYGSSIENAENVILIGGPGTGKSHVATVIGVQAIGHHRRAWLLAVQPVRQRTAVPPSEQTL